jgi:hypothetical protein
MRITWSSQVLNSTLIHHQVTTCCVDCGRSSLRSITYTPHSSLLVALLMVRDGYQIFIIIHCVYINQNGVIRNLHF